MKLYHGTNQDIDKTDLTKGLKHKDFGQGFYLTPNQDTAKRMAQKKARLFGGEPVVIVYEIDNNILNSNELLVKVFPEKATAEWILFVDKNRDRSNHCPCHNFDIVVGPIADDGIVLQLTSMHINAITPEQAAANVQDRFLDQQYYFGSEKALTYLSKEEVWKI